MFPCGGRELGQWGDEIKRNSVWNGWVSMRPVDAGYPKHAENLRRKREGDALVDTLTQWGVFVRLLFPFLPILAAVSVRGVMCGILHFECFVARLSRWQLSERYHMKRAVHGRLMTEVGLVD